MRRFLMSTLCVLALVAGLVCQGCGGKSGPATFYTLSPIETGPATAPVSSAVGVNIGVGANQKDNFYPFGQKQF